MSEIIKNLNEYSHGIVNYFHMAEARSFFEEMDGLVRRRLRTMIWKRWKKPKTRYKNLIKLGIKRNKAWQYANTRKKYVRVAQSPILKKSITN